MTEGEFLAEFIVLRDQLPCGNVFVRRRGLRWSSFYGFGRVSIGWDGTVTRPPPYLWPDMGAENEANMRAQWDQSGSTIRQHLLETLRQMLTESRAAIAHGAATRKRRHEVQLQEVTNAWLRGEGAVYANRLDCACCRKLLTDPESCARGIGPECWERITQVLEAARVVQPQTPVPNPDHP